MHGKNNVHTVIYCIVSIVVSNVPNSITYSTILPLKYQDTLVSIIYGTICNVLIECPVPLLNNGFMNSTTSNISKYHA
jgi:hypothetical protein